MPGRSRLAGRTRQRRSIPRSIGTWLRGERGCPLALGPCLPHLRGKRGAQPDPRNARSWSGPVGRRLMQLLPRGMQELPRPKEKPHRSSSWTSKSCYRCGSPGFGLGSGLGSPGVLRELAPGKVRVLFVLRQKRQTASAIAIPGKTVIKTSLKKTPLRQPTRKSQVSGDRNSNNRLPQARRCYCPLFFRLAGYSRGQVLEGTSSIHPNLLQFDNHVDVGAFRRRRSTFSYIGKALASHVH
jgi:hypothetical protein